jgi:hypothetical protein
MPCCADGVVGEILFWCLRHVLGMQTYLQSVHTIWVKVYSRMLKTIVPVAIALELKGGSANSKDRSNRTSYMFETTAGSRSTASSQEDEGTLQERDDEDLLSERIRNAEPSQSAKSIAKASNTHSGYLQAVSPEK